MTGEPGNSFYTEVPADQLTATAENTQATPRQYISDPEAAHDIALVQEHEGMIAARAREDYLRKTHEAGGYTPEQMENIKLMEGLQQQYSDSFDVITTREGERLLLSRPISQETIQQVYQERNGQNIGYRQLLTPDGFMSIIGTQHVGQRMDRIEKLISESDFSDLLATFKASGVLRDYPVSLPHNQTGGSVGVRVFSWQAKDLVNNRALLEVKKTTFIEAGKAHVARQKDAAPVVADNILDMFK